MNNQDSLRAQIIDAMKRFDTSDGKFQPEVGDDYIQTMFDDAIMPVIVAAMKAGELLLHRATTPQKPVAEGIVEWLERCCAVIASIHPQEDTVSKRELLNVLAQLEEGAIRACADARALKPQTDSEVMGRLLDGKSILPAKG